MRSKVGINMNQMNQSGQTNSTFFSPSGCLFFFFFLLIVFTIIIAVIVIWHYYSHRYHYAKRRLLSYEISYGINGSGDTIWMVGRLEFQRPMGGQQLIYRTRSGDGYPQNSTDLSSSCRLYISLPQESNDNGITGG